MIRLLIGTASIAGLLAIYRRWRRPRRRNLVVIEGDGIRRIAQGRVRR
jgi:hypothetical protein